MAMKGYSAFPKAPALLRLFSVISRTLVWGVLPLCRGAVSVFYSPSLQDNLTVFQSWFLRDGYMVFFSDMIRLMISTFICSSWVNVCVCVFAVYQSLSFSVSLGVSCFPVSIVWIIVLGICWCICRYICWWIYSISRSENQPFFIIVLTWSASLWYVVLNLANSVQISIIFLYTLFM